MSPDDTNNMSDVSSPNEADRDVETGSKITSRDVQMTVPNSPQKESNSSIGEVSYIGCVSWRFGVIFNQFS